MANSDGDVDSYQAPVGVVHGVVGVVLLIIGEALLRNLNEDPVIFGMAATAALGAGLYLTITGAVARGIQLARR